MSFQEQALAEATNEQLGYLETIKASAKSRWAAAPFPTRKTEHWKYTHLKKVEQVSPISPNSSESASESLLAASTIDGLDSIDLVFVNGCFDKHASTATELPEGLVLTRFADANPEQQAEIAQRLDSVVSRAKANDHLFASLNSAQIQDGVFIQVKKNTQLTKAIRILHVCQSVKSSFSTFSRVLVHLESGAEAHVVEQFQSESGSEHVLGNHIHECILDDNSALTHYRLHMEEENVGHIGAMHAALHANSRLNSFHLSLGAFINRVDINVHHLGKGAHCELNGVYLPKNKQHVDYHTCIEHTVPHCTSNEVFRGIVSDEAKAVFNGRIHIHQDAQKTLAQLSNKNLLTSNKAEVDTKPELEIYADDVQCAHGATVAQLNELSLHYLRTRGVSKEEARVMLSFGFINELINDLAHESVGDYLRPLLAKRFAGASDLARHLLT